MKPRSEIEPQRSSPAATAPRLCQRGLVRTNAVVLAGAALTLDAGIFLSDQARASTVEDGAELNSLAACDAEPVSTCEPKALGQLEVGIAPHPLNAGKNLPLSGSDLKAKFIERALAKSLPNADLNSRAQASQGDIDLVPASTRIDGQRSSNTSKKIVFVNTVTGVSARNAPPQKVPVSDGVEERRPVSAPTPTPVHYGAHRNVIEYGVRLTPIPSKGLHEALAAQSDSSESAKPMASHAPFNSLPIIELYEVEATARHETGAGAFTLAGPPTSLSAQISAGTGSEMMDDADVAGRARDFTIDASATAGFETNPFLIDLPDSDTTTLRLGISPTFSRQWARGDFRASARIEHIEYTASYDSVQNVAVDLGSSVILNERLEGNVELSYDSGVFVTNLFDLEPGGISSDEVGVLPGGDDITLLGLDQRRIQYQAGGGLQYQLSERDELDASISFRSDRFAGRDNQDLQESDFLTARMSYTRQVNSGLTIGVAVDASNIDFVEQSLGGVSTISPQAIVGIAFSPTWELSGSLGITSIQSRTIFSEENSTAFSGDVSICRTGVRVDLCLTGARQVLPFGVGGAGLQSNVGASYSLRVSERETFSITANYGRASEAFLAEGIEVENVSGFLNYQLELSPRVRLSADARYVALRFDLGSNISNFQALVGITLGLGRTR